MVKEVPHFHVPKLKSFKVDAFLNYTSLDQSLCDLVQDQTCICKYLVQKGVPLSETGTQYLPNQNQNENIINNKLWNTQQGPCEPDLSLRVRISCIHLYKCIKICLIYRELWILSPIQNVLLKTDCS